MRKSLRRSLARAVGRAHPRLHLAARVEVGTGAVDRTIAAAIGLRVAAVGRAALVVVPAVRLECVLSTSWAERLFAGRLRVVTMLLALIVGVGRDTLAPTLGF